MENFCRNISLLTFLMFALSVFPAKADNDEAPDIDMKEIIFGHVLDSYEWHITSIGETELSIPLPIMVYSQKTGFHFFMSNKISENGGIYEGLTIGDEESGYDGKLIEKDNLGNAYRPFDFSITKNVLSLLINCIILICIVLGVARWYKKNPDSEKSPGGFVGYMEMFIMMVNDSIIKDSVGPNYRRFSPYLLTAFFFIFLNNIMGLIPIFPGGANVTGNIAVTMVLAICTFIAINLFGTKHYWKDIFWPDVPWWLKVPIPIMPLIEIFGIFTKPISLMIRLFANIMSGHISILVLTSLIFLTAKMSPVINGSMTLISVLFDIFMNCLEVLVAFIQAYVFTMLSAIFIGLAQDGEPQEIKKETKEKEITNN